MTATRTSLLALVLAVLTVPAAAQTVDVPNPSFDKGDDAPAGWSLSGGRGEWIADGVPHGARAVAVTGDGKDNNRWLSDPVPLEPGAVYRLTFRARRSAAPAIRFRWTPRNRSISRRSRAVSRSIRP